MTPATKRRRGRRLVDGVEMDWRRAKRLNRRRRNLVALDGIAWLSTNAHRRAYVREVLVGDTAVVMAGGETIETRPNPYWRQA